MPGQNAPAGGAAAALGLLGIAEELLEQGCHVALSDLDASTLKELVDDLKDRFGRRVLGIPLDIGKPTIPH